ncbi:MAG: FHA domain-containing protein [Pirellulales bacterium]|nr:FHA domain-containing protein [Pirellulales bacterium]
MIVLGGSRAGLEIPLKKSKFVIGRSGDCTLRAGSDAISRHHCEIRLTRSKISIVDLGSRNGTFVNGQLIEAETDLKSGDEVAVGPLRFQVLLCHGLDTQKRPEVKDVADAAVRAAEKGRDEREDHEASISRWLTDPASDSLAMHETTTMQLDQTNAATISPFVDEMEDEEKPAEVEAKPEETKNRRKNKPGKLPPVPKSKAKDSCEAAAEVLRALARRR